MDPVITTSSCYTKTKSGMRLENVPKESVKFELAITHFNRLDPEPIRRLQDLKFEFKATEWDEVFLFNFHLAHDWPMEKVNWTPHSVPTYTTPYFDCKQPDGTFLWDGSSLPPDIRQYVSEFIRGEDEYAILKFDVLAQRDGEWFMVDPGTGIKP